MSAKELHYQVAELKAQLEAERTRKNELAMELMVVRNNAMHTPESLAAGRAFKPKSSDVRKHSPAVSVKMALCIVSRCL